MGLSFSSVTEGALEETCQRVRGTARDACIGLIPAVLYLARKMRRECAELSVTGK